ncbi:hypothetical protein BI364_11200 [Acidihalobacter yilgarnensis]|uniref:DUF2802 domain-containing protein n=1 Tax=Acidihalobacter yilgarnensis TaxID=2819280 RepID=A0A1D8IPS6_9GAMM|nr:DUF2802 domain-containing protein [Acidihalobacter yilgarnensis]AOU98446.1 hypothetical protein BI364_11200 [Acidihalobacter yilgarnensis]
MHIDWLSVLVALDLIYFPVVAAWAAWQVLKLRGERETGKTQTAFVQSQLESLRQSIQEMRQRDAELEERFDTLYSRLRERVDSQELRAQAPGGAHVQALKLLERGMPADELMTVCGLSRGEVDLLQALHVAGAGRHEASDPG